MRVVSGRGFLSRALATALLAVTAAWAHAPTPDPVAVRGESCVAPTDVMRRDHMDFLLHQRDRTVIEGIRTPRFALERCVSCHAAKDDTGDYARVDAPGQFCNVCHEYAAVQIDCFGCHAAKPYVEENAGIDAYRALEEFVMRQDFPDPVPAAARGDRFHE